MMEFAKLKETYDTIAKAMVRGKEPSEELLAVTAFLDDVCASNGQLLVPADDLTEEEQKGRYLAKEIKWILEDMSPALIKKMLRERSGDDQYLAVCGGLLERYLKLMLVELKRGYFNKEFLLACRQIFDHDCVLHKLNFQIEDSTLERLYTQGSGQTWRQDLNEGDHVDVLLHHVDGSHTSRAAGWAQARIGAVAGDRLDIKYLMEPSDSDRSLDRWSVEIAPYESKTKELWEWKKTIKVDDQLDVQDEAFKWTKATILQIFEVGEDGRSFPMALVAMRIYVADGARRDDRGAFEGWSTSFDEKIPLYSPRICKFQTKTNATKDQEEVTEEAVLDDVIKPEEGQSRVWAVPRPRACQSSEYMRHINLFAHNGGLDSILSVIESAEISEKEEKRVGGFNLRVLAILLSTFSLPSAVYHKDVIAEYGPKLIEASKKRILSAPDIALREATRETLEAVIAGIDRLQRRLVAKAERERQVAALRRSVALLCLNSSYLERRIYGIRELTQLIKTARAQPVAHSGKELVDWMRAEGVFDVLFDRRKTHAQLVQRCDEVLKLLLHEDMLDVGLLEQFWGLTKTEMRLEAYKIISTCSFQFKQAHLDYILDQIKNHTPIEKLDMEEFNCLSELGRYPKDSEPGFHEKVAEFFWDLIVSRSTNNLELIDNCIQKYRDTVRQWTLEAKQEIFQRLLTHIKDPNTATLPCLKLFTAVLKDQSARTPYTTGTQSTTTGSMGTYPYTASYSNLAAGQGSTGSGYGGGGTALRTKGLKVETTEAPTGGQAQGQGQGQGQGQETSETESAEPKVVLTLEAVLAAILGERKLMEALLDDLAAHSKAANEFVGGLDKVPSDRKKLFVNESQYSHHEEIDERLTFIKYVASMASDYCLSKKELGVIYDLLVTRSTVESDQLEFLTWCKSSCEAQTTKSKILELREVGEFFTEKIESQELDVPHLAPVGFEFLQHYFISVNEEEGNLERKKITQTKSYTGSTGRSWNQGGWSNAWGSGTYKTEEKEESKAQAPEFILLKLPSELKELKMLWTLVLDCQNPEVVPRVIDFLIKAHLSLSTDKELDLDSKRLVVLQGLIDKCMNILKDDNGSAPLKSVRVIEILKNLVHETEVKGTGDVVPHGAILRGEPLDQLSVQNKVTNQKGELTVQVYSSTTLWDLKREISQCLDVAPKQIKLGRGSATARSYLKEIDNGKTMKALGIKGGETLVVEKKKDADEGEQIPNLDLTGSDRELTPAARQIFKDIFDRYRAPEGGWLRDNAALFIQAACGDLPSGNDNRLSTLFAEDGNKDGRLEEYEFVKYYGNASRERAHLVRENLKALNVRPDLKWWSQVGDDENSSAVEERPRYFMSCNEANFQILMNLLDGKDSNVSGEAWELIQMLATNQTFYQRVLKLEIAKKEGSAKVEWSKFFDRSSTYRLLYTLQIVQAVLEDTEADPKRATVLNAEDYPGPRVRKYRREERAQKAKETEQETTEEVEEITEAQQLKKQKSESKAVADKQEEQLRAQWAEGFLMEGGFQHILDDFMQCPLPAGNSGQNESSPESFELKYLAFSLHLLKSFIMAAFATQDNSNYAVASLARRTSSIKESDTKKEQVQVDMPQEGACASFVRLKKLLDGPYAFDIIESIDGQGLQRKVLGLIAHLLSNKTLVFEDKLIIENALNLWTCCLLNREELFTEFVESKDSEVKVDEFILSGLLFCPYESVRQEFSEALGAICRQKPKDPKAVKPLDYVIKLLVTNFGLISENPSQQYFALFCELLDQYFLENKLRSAKNLIDPESLLSAVINQIRDANIKTQKAKEEDIKLTASQLKEQAEFFQGLLQLAGKILDQTQDENSDLTDESATKTNSGGEQQRGLIEEIFTKFLFPTAFDENGGNQSKALTIGKVIEDGLMRKQPKVGTASKAPAYKLLASLLKRDPQLYAYFLDKFMTPLMQIVDRQERWDYLPASVATRYQPYLGLRNLGCICYMISILQQFYMIPTFRYNMLCADDGKPAEKVVVEGQSSSYRNYKGEEVDDNMLHQLQKLMANLELSERSDFDPWEFCFAMKEFGGEPTITSEQKDAQEFLNLAFERLETALKGTSRKYLLQSVFGGKTCGQLICKNCGKVKNRIESFYNLSLQVKDRKSAYESLQGMISEEDIGDYECGACKKRGYVKKRMLIAETPNVLILHLQRIVFNFDTFQQDKLNSFFDFPQVLDLEPYSYHHVMGKERAEAQKKKEAAGEQEEEKAEGENQEQEKEEEEKTEEQKREEEEESKDPPPEDCFEYKLVGVNVHSGTANAGHYWSVINTKRGREQPVEGENGATWASTADDPWMEFNDSNVRDFDATKLKEECFGGDASSGGGGFGLSSFDGWGGSSSYGKSGYLVFYERRRKKPLRLLDQDDSKKVVQAPAEEAKVEAKQSEEEKKKEEEEEKIIEMDFRQAVSSSETPNRMFRKVLESNRKDGFEKDIYSDDFFQFVLGLAQVAVHTDDAATRQKAVQICSKVTLEILAKAHNNASIDKHLYALVQLLKSGGPELLQQYMSQWWEEDGFEYLFSLLLECGDLRVRQGVSALLRYVLVALKMHEKDYLYEAEEYEVVGDNGDKMMMERHKSLCARFVMRAIELFNTKVARNWSRFNQFHALLYTFATADVTDVEDLLRAEAGATGYDWRAKGTSDYTTTTPAARIGLEFLMKAKFVEKACDFMLGKKSPLASPTAPRPELGGYTSPDFGALVKLLTELITDDELLAVYPLSEIERQMLLHQSLLKTLLGSGSGNGKVVKKVGQCLALLCKDDMKLSSKVAKVFLRTIDPAPLDAVRSMLRAVKPFLASDDSLKLQKLEWVLGVPEIVTRQQYGQTRVRYGLEVVERDGHVGLMQGGRVDEATTNYGCPIIPAATDEVLLAQIVKYRGRLDLQCINCIKEVLSLMRKDKVVAEFVYKVPPQTYQYARTIDWWRPYLEEQAASNATQMANQQSRAKHELATKALAHLDALEPWFAEQRKTELELLGKALAGGKDFSDLADNWVGATSDEVLKHYPPRLIVGAAQEERELVCWDDDARVTVQLFELDCDYAYSAPTGRFNVQAPHLALQTGVCQTQSYAEYMKSKAAEAAKQANADLTVETDQQPQAAEDAIPPLESGDSGVSSAWATAKRQAPVLLRVVITNKSKDQDLKVRFRVEQKAGAAAPNVELRSAMTKMYLNGGHARLGCILMKIDPTKPFFFENMDDVKVALEIKERNTGLYSAGNRTYGNTNTSSGYAGRRAGVRVGHAAQVETVGVGSPSSDGVDNGRDDDAEAYGNWADGAGRYPAGGQMEEECGQRLLFGAEREPCDLSYASGGNSSTGAVADAAHGSRQNSVTELDDANAGPSFCQDCQLENPPGEMNCARCGTFVGGEGTYYSQEYSNNPNQMD